ncbi:MAG TPA: hypothetical protein VFH73_05340 [Polyangia bacterium]|nr:hypothetical protein [Polyangia bacterium]
MKHAIEVAHLVNGEVLSVRTLCRTREWRQVSAAVGFVALMFMAAMALVTAIVLGAHRVLYTPEYLAVWTVAATAVAWIIGRRVLARARRYAVGAGIDNDAFAGDELDLVRRTRDGYQLTVLPGMTGTFAGGRSPVPIESLMGGSGTGSRGTRLHLGPDTRAEINTGTTTFVVRSIEEPRARQTPGRAFFKGLARPVLTAMQLTAVVSLLGATPMAVPISEADMRSSIPADATPWEIEKMLRVQAQNQSHTLYRCFDVMPLECHRPGYVAVGLSLSRQGEVRSNWVSRSTFGIDCPVEQCMADVISNWFFEPLPASMRVVLPVQVLRTEKLKPAAHADAESWRRCGRSREVN